jgi:hypothetical protein
MLGETFYRNPFINFYLKLRYKFSDRIFTYALLLYSRFNTELPYSPIILLLSPNERKYYYLIQLKINLSENVIPEDSLKGKKFRYTGENVCQVQV